MLLYGLAFAIIRFYGTLLVVLLLLFYGIRRLKVGDRFGWLFIVLATIPPGLLFATVVYLSKIPEIRGAEVASWQRTAIPTPRPRTLIIEMNRMVFRNYRDAVLRLAESGQFDVYVASRTIYRRPTKYSSTQRQTRPVPDKVSYSKVEVGEWGDCADRRKEKTDFVIRTGYTTCGKFVSVAKAPDQGLVLYAGHDVAPLAAKPLFSKETSMNWTFQLGLRGESTEALIAYEENITYPRFHLLPPIGLHLVKGEFARKYLTSNSYAPDSGDLDNFTFKSLGIDPAKIVVPSTLPTDAFAAHLYPLIANGTKEASLEALRRIALYPGTSRQLAKIVEDIAANPRVSSDLWHMISCSELDGLDRYRNSMIDGCMANREKFSPRCALLGDMRSWFQICTDTETPVWGGSPPMATRVLIAGTVGRNPSGITINGRNSDLMTIRIPSDRGPLHVAVQAQTNTIWKVTGAVECLYRLTVIDGNAAVLGVVQDRVEFRYREFAGFSYNRGREQLGEVALNPELNALLGAPPDIPAIKPRTHYIDLADFIDLSAIEDPALCKTEHDAAALPPANPSVDGSGGINPQDVLTVPTYIPLQSPKEM